MEERPVFQVYVTKISKFVVCNLM